MLVSPPLFFPVITSFQTRMNMFTVQPVNLKEKSDIADEVTLFCCKDMRSFRTVQGKGFIDMIQAIINLAGVKGKINAKELLPSPSTA